MRRLAVLLVLTACNVTPSTPAPPVANTRAPASDPWANPTPPPPSPVTYAPALPTIEHPNPPAAEPPPRTYGPAPQPPAPHAIVAPPSQAMRALAVTPDGNTAVTADVTGSVRLWPTLDGAREPLVVPMRRPVALAATRATDGRGVAIAGIDGVGQLELVVTSALGASPVRTPVELPRPATAVHATTLGFLVELDDQHLTFVTATGQRLGDVEPPAGTDIAAIAVHGDAMLALLDGGGMVHARWLNLAKSRLAWGDQTGALPILPRAIALAPDHTSIAAVEPGEKAPRLVVVGLAHGDKRAEGPASEFDDPSMQLVGFVDATTVLVHFSSFTSLWHTDGDFTTLNEERRAPVTAVAGSRIVSGTAAELEIADAAGTVRFLGFRIGTLSMFAPGARTILATDGQHLVRLASDLRDHATYELPEPHDAGYSVLTLLDADHVLVQSYRSETYFDVVALDTMEMTPLPNDERFIGYDPATRLAAFVTNDKVRFRRFDAKAGTFGDAADLDASNVSSVMFAGDRAIVASYRTDDTYAEQSVARIRPEAHTLKVLRTVTHRMQMTDEGGFIPPATTIDYTRTAKSPDGALVATIELGRMSLHDADGRLRWTTAARGASDLIWLRSGELFATGAGLARVDLETGAYAERRCGWQFGLWSERVDVFASAQICEAE